MQGLRTRLDGRDVLDDPQVVTQRSEALSNRSHVEARFVDSESLQLSDFVAVIKECLGELCARYEFRAPSTDAAQDQRGEERIEERLVLERRRHGAEFTATIDGQSMEIEFSGLRERHVRLKVRHVDVEVGDELQGSMSNISLHGRLGDGTEESHERMQRAINELWMFTGDLFDMDEVDAELIKSGVGVDKAPVKILWSKHVEELLLKATLVKPVDTFMLRGSLSGKHTEHLGFLLAEMQYLQRTFSGAKW